MPTDRCSGRGDDLGAVRAAVAEASRLLAGAGLVLGSAGNVSARAGQLVAVTPTGAELAMLEADDITLVDLAGAVTGGTLAPTSELDLHLAIYRRYGAGAVVHTHAPYATAIACVLEELPCVHYAMLDLGGAVRVAPYRTFGTPELAAVVLAALEGRTAALMSNHGTLALGEDIEHAVRRSQLLEWACTLYWRAGSLGTPRTLDERQLDEVSAAIEARGYGKTGGA
ncbi:MAG: class II aldolase/adducin family protein [Solirubrobacteraceae bacterium]